MLHILHREKKKTISRCIHLCLSAKKKNLFKEGTILYPRWYFKTKNSFKPPSFPSKTFNEQIWMLLLSTVAVKLARTPQLKIKVEPRGAWKTQKQQTKYSRQKCRLKKNSMIVRRVKLINSFCKQMWPPPLQARTPCKRGIGQQPINRHGNTSGKTRVPNPIKQGRATFNGHLRESYSIPMGRGELKLVFNGNSNTRPTAPPPPEELLLKRVPRKQSSDAGSWREFGRERLWRNRDWNWNWIKFWNCIWRSQSRVPPTEPGMLDHVYGNLK